MSLLGSLTIEDLTRIRKMSMPDAELFLSRHTLTDAERTSALALAGKDVEPASYLSVRRQWMTVAWLLGASYRQIGTLHGIARQTVMDIVDRTMPIADRRAARHATECSLEKLSYYRSLFNKNIEMLSGLTTNEAAQWMVDNSEYTEGEV
jgi:hypothetical protein